MGITKNISKDVGKRFAPKVTQLAPDLTTGFVRESLHRAINGVGPLPSAVTTAEKKLAAHDGDVEKAVKAVVELHVRYAGAQGFLTNLGGLVTAAVTIPTNITGLALIQCRMLACIAHLRGYDLGDTRTRNAILATLLGKEEVNRMLKKGKLPSTPMALATAPVADPDLDRAIAGEVAIDLISRVTGKRLATTLGRRVPVIGGVVGLSADAYATWKIGRYAESELLPRNRR